MKIQLFAFLLVAGAFATIQIAQAQKPQCFCAYKCDARDYEPEKGDDKRPKIVNGKLICFCQQRDVDKWNNDFKNGQGCALIPNILDIASNIPNSVCGQ